MTLAEKYIRDYEKYIIEYGKKTACLIQVDHFMKCIQKIIQKMIFIKFYMIYLIFVIFLLYLRSYTVDDDNHVLVRIRCTCNR